MKKLLPIPPVLAYFALFALATMALGFKWYRNQQAPDQPIAFSHRLHVGKVGLKCLFCHETADKSPKAGIPPVEKCMSCHRNAVTDRPEVQKLIKYWEEQRPMEWNRVHKIRIRNHVYFTHKRHIKAGLECENCHGEVKYMDKIRQVSSLEMGWCISCHRYKNAPHDCLTCHM